MGILEQLGEEANPERLAWILKLRKGHGLRKERSDVPLDLFGAKDWMGLITTFKRATMRLPKSKPLYAITEALDFPVAWGNVSDGRGNAFDEHWRHAPATLLKERREDAAEMLDTSLRTLMRLEAVGAELLDQAIGQIIFARLEDYGTGLNLAFSALDEFTLTMNAFGVQPPDELIEPLREMIWVGVYAYFAASTDPYEVQLDKYRNEWKPKYADDSSLEEATFRVIDTSHGVVIE